jgi:hypothetical protein
VIASMLRWSRLDACSIQGHKLRESRRALPVAKADASAVIEFISSSVKLSGGMRKPSLRQTGGALHPNQGRSF